MPLPEVEDALHRYFKAADLMRLHFEATSGDSAEQDLRRRIYMGSWYAGLYAVIRAWKSLGVSDKEIDAALIPSHVDLLGAFRDSVVQFQPDYDTERARLLIEDGTRIVPWARDLTESLGHWFRAAPQRSGRG